MLLVTCLVVMGLVLVLIGPENYSWLVKKKKKGKGKKK